MLYFLTLIQTYWSS